ncbi:MAG: tetratricopeptide repeat protein [Pirellulaceae bacterium]
MSSSPFVVETSADRFETDVLECSQTTPVVLDFWAAWCQPCRMLGPLLEKMADEYAGQFVVVKADVDQLPQQAAAFGVEGIPAVYALRGGQVVDSFTGLLSESQLRQWLTGIVPSPAELLVREAAALEATDPAAAEAKYRAAIELDGQRSDAAIGLARLQLTNEPEAARQILEQLERRGFLEPEAQRIQAELEMQSHRLSDFELEKLRAQATATPADAGLKLKLAEALLASRQFEEGLALCLTVVASERGPLRDEARQAMLGAFRLLGDEAELTREFRRKLAMALY